MARKWSNLNLPGALHFVTGNLVDRLPIFTEPACCNAFLEQLRSLDQKWPSKLIAYVLMPDHFHLISNPRDGRIKEFVGALKSLSAKSIVRVCKQFRFQASADGHQVWQESFKAMPLWSGWMIWQKINYIHANPVKAGLVFRLSVFRVSESLIARARCYLWIRLTKILSGINLIWMYS